MARSRASGPTVPGKATQEILSAIDVRTLSLGFPTRAAYLQQRYIHERRYPDQMARELDVPIWHIRRAMEVERLAFRPVTQDPPRVGARHPRPDVPRRRLAVRTPAPLPLHDTGGWLSTGDVARALGLSVGTVRRAVLHHDLQKGQTPGGHLRFAPAEVRRYAAQLGLETVAETTR